MPTFARWLLAIGVIVLLIAIFIITFILYKKTPVPKGCEEFEKPSQTKCQGCKVTDCHFNLYYNDIEKQAQAEVLKEQEEANKIAKMQEKDKEEEHD